jgi:hypothetical protein
MCLTREAIVFSKKPPERLIVCICVGNEPGKPLRREDSNSPTFGEPDISDFEILSALAVNGETIFAGENGPNPPRSRFSQASWHELLICSGWVRHGLANVKLSDSQGSYARPVDCQVRRAKPVPALVSLPNRAVDGFVFNASPTRVGAPYPPGGAIAPFYCCCRSHRTPLRPPPFASENALG